MDYRIPHKMKSAKEFEVQGKALHSIQIYKSLIDEYPDYYDAYLHLAELYERLGSIDAAKSVFEIVLNLQNSENDIKLYYGQFLMRTSEWNNAIDVFRKISADDEPICSYFVGYLYLLLKDYEATKVHLLNFIISDEGQELIYEAYFYLAKAEFELNQYDNSLKYLKKAEVLLSDYWELYVQYAKTYYSLSMQNHAIKSIKKAISINSKEPLVYYWAGKIFFSNSEMNKAIENYTHFLKLNEKITSDELINRANNLTRLGKLKEALVTFQKAEILNSNLINASEAITKSKIILDKKII